jgi:RNA polymerase sigma-70 factor (ECF subfamily)
LIALPAAGTKALEGRSEWHLFLTVNRQETPSEVQSARRLTVVAGEGGGSSAAGGTRVPLSAVPLSEAQQGASADQREALLRSLVDRIRENDLAAFDQLYLLTRDEAARTLFHLVGRRAEIEDLLQETYLRLLSAAKTYRGEAKFRTFLYRVCANTALMHLRWRRRRPEDVMAEIPEPEAAPTSSSGPENEASRHEAARLVEAALEGLTAKKRVVFVYHELCGMGPEEIAAIVGTSPNTVRSRLHHARLEFNEAMQRLLKAPRESSGGAHGVR